MNYYYLCVKSCDKEIVFRKSLLNPAVGAAQLKSIASTDVDDDYNGDAAAVATLEQKGDSLLLSIFCTASSLFVARFRSSPIACR